MVLLVLWLLVSIVGPISFGLVGEVASQTPLPLTVLVAVAWAVVVALGVLFALVVEEKAQRHWMSVGANEN